MNHLAEVGPCSAGAGRHTRVFGACAPRMLSLGYCVLPIAPGTKAPGVYAGRATEADVAYWRGRGRPEIAPAAGAPMGRKLTEWTEFTIDYLVGEHRHAFDAWCRAPHTGIGVMTGDVSGGLVAIDLDTDDAGAMALLETLPGLDVSKAGAKGKTRFFRFEASDVIPSAGLPGLLDVLCDGRQTVLPPTIHPNGAAYTWTGEARLDELEPRDLPLLGSKQLASFIDSLLRLGLRAGEASSNRPQIHLAPSSRGGGGLYGEVNRRAMAKPELWVPQLNLFGLQARAGGYVAVPGWRASSTGRSLEQRSRNLSIHASGIVDFGTGTGYSPIDLVSRTEGLEAGDAMLWLQARVGPDLPPWQPRRPREDDQCPS